MNTFTLKFPMGTMRVGTTCVVVYNGSNNMLQLHPNSLFINTKDCIHMAEVGPGLRGKTWEEQRDEVIAKWIKKGLISRDRTPVPQSWHPEVKK